MSLGFGFSLPASGATPGGPTLNLQFAGATALDPSITFTRASSGTYFDSAGVLQRATYNLLTYSEQFDNAAWGKSNASITANAAAAPDGTVTADLFVPNTSSTDHSVTTSAGSVSSGAAFTFSVYVKAAGYSWVRLSFGNTAGGGYAFFNVATGAVGVVSTGASEVASIQSVGDGWFRCVFTRTTSLSGSLNADIYAQSANNQFGWAGNGTSGVLVWGAQVEQASTAGPYYATTTAANGAPRFDYNPTTLAPRGLLIEEQRTNLLLRSEQFDNAAWIAGGLTVGANVTASPDGAVTADKISEDATTGGHLIVQNTPSLTTATTYTFSVFLKAAERTFAFVGFNTGSMPTVFVSVNLTNGTVATATGSPVASAIQAVGNGWYRVSISATTTGSGFTNADVRTSTDGVWANRSYTGTTGSGIFIWGAQLEAGAFSTSYIPTVAAQVTRSADSASMTGTNFSSWYRADEGTLFAEFVIGQDSDGSRFFANIDDGGNTNAVDITSSNIATVRGVISSGGAQQAVMTSNASAIGSVCKGAVAYRVNDFAFSANGAAAVTDTAGNIPVSPNRLSIGSYNGGAGNFTNTAIRRIAFYPARLANATLQALTT